MVSHKVNIFLHNLLLNRITFLTIKLLANEN